MTIENSSKILVTGATGRHGSTGHYVVQRLIEEGRSVCALVRRRDERSAALEALGAEIVIGDLHDRRSLIPALEGVGIAYFTYPINAGIVEAAANFASAARTVSGRSPRVVVMSMAPTDPLSPSPLCRAQWLAEEIFLWADLDLTVLRVAAFFYENILTLHGHSIRNEGRIANSFGDVGLPWISGFDAAEMGVAAILKPELFKGRAIHYLPNAEMRSHVEIARMLSEKLGKPIPFEFVAMDTWRDMLLALAEAEPGGTVNRAMASHISALSTLLRMAAQAADGKRLTPPLTVTDLKQLIGRQPMSFSEFLDANLQKLKTVDAA